MNFATGVLFIVLCLDLILMGILFATPEEIVNRGIHEIDLAFTIICTFIMWAVQCGAVSYTITSTYNDETKEIHFG